MIKKIGRYLIGKLQYIIPEKILIRYAQGILNKKDRSILTSIARGYFDERYKHASPEKKKQLGLLVWGSKAAIHYFEGRSYSEDTIKPFLTVIRENQGFDVCEIGTGNGNLITKISEDFPNRTFTAIDLSDEQIELNKRSYQKENVRFICADILEYVKNNTTTPTIFISYVSLTTFTPDMVNELFEQIKNRKSQSIIALYEPVESNPPDGEHSVLRSGLAYAHNYITVAKQKGFTVIKETSDSPFLWLVCKTSIE